MKLTVAIAAVLATYASAFAPSQVGSKTTALSATGFEEVGGKPWDPLSLGTLGDGEAGDFAAFPSMFPSKPFLQEAEIKHGRMSMLAWTGVWATHEGGLGLGMHIPGMPIEADWAKALGVFAAEQPAMYGAILLTIGLLEGETGKDFAFDGGDKATKREPGNLGFDPWGLKVRLTEEQQARYKIVELKNGRAAMIAMLSLFTFESIPGSVPLMDLFGAS